MKNGELRRRRAASQLLHAPRRRSADELVRHLLGLQAQGASQAALGLRARSGGLTADLVRDATERDRTIVRTWAMRGTIHLVAAEDHGLLVPLVTESREPNAFRRLRQEGVPAEQAERAVGLVERMLEDHAPLTRPEIVARLHRRRIRTDGQAIAHLVWLAAARGAICFGPGQDGEETYVLVRDWIGEPEPMVRDAALAEVAIRYLRAHAPAGPRDLATWSGLRPADAKRAWRLVTHRLREVATPAGPAWALRGRQAEVRRLPARLLPAFDEYLLGWKDRDAVVAPNHGSRVNRGGGWLHPVAIADGRVVATWRIARTGTTARLELEPFVRLTPSVLRELRREAKGVGAFLGVPLAFD